MKLLLNQIDWLLLAPISVLLIISLVVLQSINPAYLQSQLFSLTIAIVAFFVFSQIPYKDYQPYIIPFYIFTLILLLIIFIIGIESRGAIRWVEVFGIRLQPSEIGKPLLSLTFAGYLASRHFKSLRTYCIVLVFMLPIVSLVYYQPDLGNALLYLGVFILTLIIFGLPLLWIVVTYLPIILSVPFIWNILHEYQRQRVLTFLNPLRDPQGTSYNMIQAIIAVGSGMFLGKGLGEGTQSRLRFLPENHTDFIFASLGEKMGFLGSFLIIAAFIFLLFRILQIFRRTEDIFGKIFIICSFLFILLHFFVNVGMNLGLVPIVGVTLPFVSFGGSSLLANFITIGILSSISVGNRKVKILEIQ